MIEQITTPNQKNIKISDRHDQRLPDTENWLSDAEEYIQCKKLYFIYNCKSVEKAESCEKVSIT